MATAHASYQPTGEPDNRRKFQLTNLQGNNNKYYLVETWPLPDGQVFFNPHLQPTRWSQHKRKGPMLTKKPWRDLELLRKIITTLKPEM